MSTWCRTGRHGECEDAGCTCACHLRHLETVEMVERCAKHQGGGLMAVVPAELGNQGDEAAPMATQYHAASDEGRADHVPLSDE